MDRLSTNGADWAAVVWGTHCCLTQQAHRVRASDMCSSSAPLAWHQAWWYCHMGAGEWWGLSTSRQPSSQSRVPSGGGRPLPESCSWTANLTGLKRQSLPCNQTTQRTRGTRLQPDTHTAMEGLLLYHGVQVQLNPVERQRRLAIRQTPCTPTMSGQPQHRLSRNLPSLRTIQTLTGFSSGRVALAPHVLSQTLAGHKHPWCHKSEFSPISEGSPGRWSTVRGTASKGSSSSSNSKAWSAVILALWAAGDATSSPHCTKMLAFCSLGESG